MAEVPLAQALKNLRAELLQAIEAGKDEPLRFELDSVAAPGAACDWLICAFLLVAPIIVGNIMASAARIFHVVSRRAGSATAATPEPACC